LGARGQFGSAARSSSADRHDDTPEPGATPGVKQVLKVNHPVEMDGATIFLLGNGYAPIVTVKDAHGAIVYSGPTVFLARDNNYTSSGAIKVPAATPKELGFFGNFLPTGVITEHTGPISVFPDVRDPKLALGLYEGVLNPSGQASSVYTLNTKEMTQVKSADGKDVLRLWLSPGETVTLPGDRGSITFDGVERWAGLSIRHDPARWLTLGSALLALGALIAQLTIKRRRVFVRVAPGDGATLVTLGALSKSDDAGLGDVLDKIGAAITSSAGSPRHTPPRQTPVRGSNR
jgi:cytochrome c biogenesis protein